MKPKVKNALLKIADKFSENLSEDLKVEDIILTGSLANYNWSNYSDFDLHLVIDFKQFGKQAELYKELFSLKKQLFNQNHDIKIFGYEVELYAQDSEESHFSTGVYSVKNDEWITAPSKEKSQIDREVFKTKINSWKEKIENLIKNIKKDGIKSSEKQIDSLKEKLKDYRKSGLEKEGEYSYENLVFKYLRRSKLIEKLYNTIVKQTDKELSVETRKIE
jgi:predicted nucleotidyltransferase